MGVESRRGVVDGHGHGHADGVTTGEAEANGVQQEKRSGRKRFRFGKRSV